MTDIQKYNFETAPERRHPYALKWQGPENEIPLWVADMDFETAPEIKEKISEIASRGTFGYTDIPDSWAESYISWWKKQHDFETEKDWYVFVTGVVPALSSIVRRLTLPNEKVCIMPPVYGVFWNSIQNQGRQVAEAPLDYDKATASYKVNWELLEATLKDPQCSLFIFCNPHNPTGHIWTSEELKRIGEIASRENVIVVSDEIHCDLTLPGKNYIPFASVSSLNKDISITCVSPSKAFNIAGLHSAAVIIPNKSIRHRVYRGFNNEEIGESGVFGAEVTETAFTKGGNWLTALKEVLKNNRDAATEYLENNIPGIKVVRGEATYLLWVDFSAITDNDQKLTAFLRKEMAVRVSPGSGFGTAGKGFIRINMACPKSRLMEGLRRISEAVKKFLAK